MARSAASLCFLPAVGFCVLSSLSRRRTGGSEQLMSTGWIAGVRSQHIWCAGWESPLQPKVTSFETSLPYISHCLNGPEG